jgi:uncharacterized membrane protein YphA (DoxX/SURF4 family)
MVKDYLMTDFLKNLGLIGGLLMVYSAGADAVSLDARTNFSSQTRSSSEL